MELTAQLKVLSQRYGTTLFTTILAGWGALLSRLSGQTDVVIGTPVANRRHAEVEELIGFFVNTLAVRLDYSDNPTVSDVLERVKQQSVQAQQHQDLPFEQVVELINPPRSLSHAPIFQVMFAWQNNGQARLELEGLDVTPLAARHSVAKFDLSLELREVDGCIHGALEYATALFERATVERYVEYLRRVLVGMTAAETEPISCLAMMPESERQQLVVEWNATEAPYPADRCVHELFEEQVARTPDAVALVHEDTQLTYGELNARANRLAHYLRECGVMPDTRVALCMERSIELVVSLLAVLKAGGAYVPLDPSYPLDRLEYMLEDCGARIFLSRSGEPSAVDGDAQRIDVDRVDGRGSVENLGLVWSSDATAYIMYTSGSTGTPKGVLVPHRAIARLVINNGYADFGADDRVAFAANPAFDASTMEVWAPLLNGGRIVVIEQDTLLTPERFKEHLLVQGVTVLWLTAGLFAQYADALSEAFGRLRFLIVGGDVLDVNAISQVLAHGRPRHLLNGYGPTETTTFAATYEVRALGDRVTSIPIGRPIANTRVYILDEHLEPVPIGVAGELYIGGAGVARGYLNRPELTAERFIASPFVAGDRLYKTGDVARYLADGNIEYLGRNDFQVKIRGFRIELGEIESALLQYAGIRDAVVVACDDRGEKRLVAYYTAADASLNEAESLRTHLQNRLPEYMVPAAYVHLDVLPLTANGKVDRKALPAPDDTAYASREYAAPQGAVEEAIAQIWSELLGVDRVGRNDNFFELGGHSLLVVRVIDRMRTAGLHADVRTLFTAPTLVDLAVVVSEQREVRVEIPPNRIPSESSTITPEMLPLVELTAEQIDRIVAGVPGGARNIQDIYPLAPLQEGILFHHLLEGKGDPYLLHAVYRFASRDRVDAYLAALQAVIDRHDILRTSFVWEGLPEAAQVVWRTAVLSVEEVVLDAADGEIAQQLFSRFDPRHYRLDVRRAPLMQMALAQEPSGSWVLMHLFHHLVLDHTALEVVQHEIGEHLRGEADQLPEPVPFRTLVAQARLGVSRADHEAFFRAMLGDVGEPTLPYGLADVQGDGSEIREAYYSVESSLTKRLRERARRLSVSAASICHVAWARVLSALSGRDDVVFGTVLFGRMQGGAGAARAMGLFLNTLPMRVKVDATSAEAGVWQMHKTLADLMHHEHASLALAQRCSGVVAPVPLFSALLNYRHISMESVTRELDGIEALAGGERTNYPVTLSINDFGEELSFSAQVHGSVDATRTCSYMHQALEELVEALERAPETALKALRVLPESERQQLVVEWNATEAPYPADRCVHELFEEQVARTPDAVALVHEDTQLTYGELNARANRLAHYLRECGVMPDTRVALCMERSIELVVSLLAVLKAGGAYVPLDPSYPLDRLEYMLVDSAPAVVLTHGAVAAAVQAVLGLVGAPVVEVDEHAGRWADASALNPVRRELTPAHLAYIIYTSGSTGRPKGVMVGHANVARLFEATARLVPCLMTYRRCCTTGLPIHVPLIFRCGRFVGAAALWWHA